MKKILTFIEGFQKCYESLVINVIARVKSLHLFRNNKLVEFISGLFIFSIGEK